MYEWMNEWELLTFSLKKRRRCQETIQTHSHEFTTKQKTVLLINFKQLDVF